MTSPRTLAASLLALVIVAGCGTGGSASPSGGPPSGAPSGSAAGDPTVFPQIVSSELTVGPNRVLFSFLDETGKKPVAGPDRTAKVRFLGPSGEVVEAPDGMFIWAIEDVSGVYVTNATFPAAGNWTAEFTTAAPGAPTETIPFAFTIKEDASVVRPGEPAPSVDTPTIASAGGDVANISTDSAPVEAFYETSVADALAAHEPFVLVFATPKFCASATCGPTLDRLKPIAEAQPDLTFINVEPYQLEMVEGQLQPVLGANGFPRTVAASDAFGLLSEPYVFVVGRDGLVSSSFELVFSDEEIEAAIDALEAPGG